MGLAMNALGFAATKAEVQKMITEMDKDGDGKADLMKGFQYFDSDRTGTISFKNIKKVAGELGDSMTDDEIRGVIAEANRDGTGAITEKDFLRIMVKTGLLEEHQAYA